MSPKSLSFYSEKLFQYFCPEYCPMFGWCWCGMNCSAGMQWELASLLRDSLWPSGPVACLSLSHYQTQSRQMVCILIPALPRNPQLRADMLKTMQCPVVGRNNGEVGLSVSGYRDEERRGELTCVEPGVLLNVRQLLESSITI